MAVSKGDEFYTPEWLVRKFRDAYDLHGRKIYLPFDTERSFFYKVLNDDNEVMLKEYDDFFNTPNEFLEELSEEGYEIFTNPPFSVEKKILHKLRRTSMKYSLLAFGTTWGGLVDGTTDSVHYVGYVKYENPPDVIERYEIIRKIRTVLIVRDGLHEMRKAPFVYSYTKPYRGGRDMDFENLPTFTAPDINIITIRDRIVSLSDYDYENKGFGTFTKRKPSFVRES